MKFATIALASSAVVHSQDMTAEVARQNTERRYAQLTEMMENYNGDFDERKYWAYGCNCLILGDRPMSDPGMYTNESFLTSLLTPKQAMADQLTSSTQCARRTRTV